MITLPLTFALAGARLIWLAGEVLPRTMEMFDAD